MSNTRRAQHTQPDAEPRLMIGPGDSSTDLLDAARAEAQREADDTKAGQVIARRLLTAFVLVLIVGVTFFVVVQYFGVYIPPILPVLTFLTIAVGTILSFANDKPERDETDAKCSNAVDDEGRPIGCCPGPRPMRMFRD